MSFLSGIVNAITGAIKTIIEKPISLAPVIGGLLGTVVAPGYGTVAGAMLGRAIAGVEGKESGDQLLRGVLTTGATAALATGAGSLASRLGTVGKIGVSGAVGGASGYLAAKAQGAPESEALRQGLISGLSGMAATGVGSGIRYALSPSPVYKAASYALIPATQYQIPWYTNVAARIGSQLAGIGTGLLASQVIPPQASPQMPDYRLSSAIQPYPSTDFGVTEPSTISEHPRTARLEQEEWGVREEPDRAEVDEYRWHRPGKARYGLTEYLEEYIRKPKRLDWFGMNLA